MDFVEARKYRPDIDGLRTVAVMSVVIFHFGLITSGFLGVDVFFVISGFLITGIIHREINENRFSLTAFYLRRTRRIIPLVLFICLLALLIGYLTMLPDDLENLAQSVVATNFFANNILQLVTTKNYWDVVNEFKPLMHTWSLGVEEQFYIIFPLLLWFAKRWLQGPVLLVAGFAGLSFILYWLPLFSEYQKFYWIFFRFWELAIGGLAAIWLNGRLITHRFTTVFIVLLTVLVCVDVSFLSPAAQLTLVVFLTTLVLSSANEQSPLTQHLMENPLVVWIGKISFSLYMWHQLILAFARYFWVEHIGWGSGLLLFAMMIALSYLSYRWIEQPFRDKQRINVKALLATVTAAFIMSNGIALYLIGQSGIVRDVPELGLSTHNAASGVHNEYNSRNHNLNKPFASSQKTKVLIVGDSFGRDWANVLRESAYADQLDISYMTRPTETPDAQTRIAAADIVFYARNNIADPLKIGLPAEKLWVVGTKNFGINNGLYYNYRGDDYYQQRTATERGFAEREHAAAERWGNRYINIMAKVTDTDGKVPVFTPGQQFISQDCRHFTQAGAQYFAELLKAEIGHALQLTGKARLTQSSKDNGRARHTL